jgi:tetratricopeptide (TPR) repeat protein
LDSYLVNYHKEQCVTHRVLLINNRLDWKWDGVVHEAIESPQAKTTALFPEAYIESSKDGFRSQDPDKFKKDIRLLEESLKKDPENSRTVFHLGVFAEEALDYPLALKYFQIRTTMGGWDQEVFYALFRVAGLQELLEMDPEVFLPNYQRAYEYRPSRAEPLFWCALYYLKKNEFSKAYDLLKRCSGIPLPQDSIYVVNGVYDYGILLCLCDCALNLGKYTETLDGYRRLLANRKLPQESRVLIEKNMPLVRLRAQESRKDPAPLKRFML